MVQSQIIGSSFVCVPCMSVCSPHTTINDDKKAKTINLFSIIFRRTRWVIASIHSLAHTSIQLIFTFHIVHECAARPISPNKWRIPVNNSIQSVTVHHAVESQPTLDWNCVLIIPMRPRFYFSADCDSCWCWCYSRRCVHNDYCDYSATNVAAAGRLQNDEMNNWIISIIC